MTPKAFTCIGVPDGGGGAGKDIKQQCIENGIKDDNPVELLIGVNTKQIAGPALTSYKNRSTCNYNVYGLQISRKGKTMTNSYLLLRTKKLSD